MTDRIDQIIEKLQQLKEIRQHLVNEPMSESGVWIHQYEVRKNIKKMVKSTGMYTQNGKLMSQFSRETQKLG
ncbi:hypothetical protein FD723_41180 (plasmid) [Nostoc sp. C052]|uniref:hypothetical protein n=1 Tax=Nostoc sp. C052 TaxID=2576902 RepID=UPI0015C31CBE|nr:hypothetical protein [Nostoc sp. C052]QLE46623.1 hypothetical protein FD723_41180 [Nostoc sp. C052]